MWRHKLMRTCECKRHLLNFLKFPCGRDGSTRGRRQAFTIMSLRSPWVATKCVWRCRCWSGQRTQVQGCLLPENLWRRKYRQSPENRVPPQDQRKSRHFLEYTREHWSPRAKFNSRGSEPTELWARGHPQELKPLPQLPASPQGTRTELVTFHP